jgi:3-deoxy-D-manno-octulosonic-acid transferase
MRPFAPRPAGKLILLHVSSTDSTKILLALALRLIEELGASVVITFDEGLPEQADESGFDELITMIAPAEHPLTIKTFFDHWKPDVAVFLGDQLRPVFLDEAQGRLVPLIMAEAKNPNHTLQTLGWWPGLKEGLLRHFRHIITVDDTAMLGFRQAGGTFGAVMSLGRMEEATPVLVYDEKKRQAFAKILNTRPIWLAADLDEAEEDAVIEAHSRALSLAHRLLLIVVPRDPNRSLALEARILYEKKWAVAQQERQEQPSQETEVLIGSSQDYGLWYRLAPITFLGGSLHGIGCARNPLEAAAMGSALIHGPRYGAFGTIISRLGAARAAHPVGTTNDICEALAELLSPDRAALSAQAAWVVESSGVEVTDLVVEMIQKSMGEV